MCFLNYINFIAIIIRLTGKSNSTCDLSSSYLIIVIDGLLSSFMRSCQIVNLIKTKRSKTSYVQALEVFNIKR
jgi:hypothetical protein